MANLCKLLIVLFCLPASGATPTNVYERLATSNLPSLVAPVTNRTYHVIATCDAVQGATNYAWGWSTNGPNGNYRSILTGTNWAVISNLTFATPWVSVMAQVDGVWSDPALLTVTNYAAPQISATLNGPWIDFTNVPMVNPPPVGFVRVRYFDNFLGAWKLD